jgi:hypothetical protein
MLATERSARRIKKVRSIDLETPLVCRWQPSRTAWYSYLWQQDISGAARNLNATTYDKSERLH